MLLVPCLNSVTVVCPSCFAILIQLPVISAVLLLCNLYGSIIAFAATAAGSR